MEANKNERSVLLHRIQVCDFVLYELNLFLDTHPDNQYALEHFKKHQAMRNEAMAAYTRKFGALTARDFTGGDHWSWVDDPWPWENQKED